MQLNTFSNNYLEEAKVRPVVLTFGRFQPPTVGHQLLITRVVSIAKKLGGEHRIYPSRTQDKKKNPLSTRDKIRFMRKFFKKANVVDDKDAITVFHVLKKLSDQGYKHIVLVVGSDRVAEFKTAISKYIGGKDGYQFDKFDVMSAGERDPDAQGVSGMSASKMRRAVTFNKYDDFAGGMPDGATDKDTEVLWNTLKKNMNIKESVDTVSSDDWLSLLWEDYLNNNDPLGELNERQLSRQARRNMSRAAKRTAGKRARRREITKKRKKSTGQLKTKAMKQARDLLRQKIAKDVDWNTASISTKERIGKILDKKQVAIAKISKKLLPGVRKQEAERIAALKQTKKTDESVELLREPEILDRLVQQLMAKGKSKDAAYAIANSQLQKHGVTKKGSTDLTKHGEKRNSMTAGERAKDRAAKKDGKSVSDYNYNAKTNTATQKESVEVEEGPTTQKFLKKIKMRKFDRDERKRKKDNHKKIMKYQKMVGISSEVEEEKERDYKKEYADFHGKPEQRAKRSKRVLARRKLEAQGRVSKGDGKDVDHKDGNAENNSDGNLRVMNRHTNRSRNNNKRHEEHGAGEEGTPELVKKLKKDTPYT